MNWASAGLLLGLLAASQFYAQTSKSSEWTTIKKVDSNIYFTGVEQPEILTVKTKLADSNEVILELLLLKADLLSHSSFIFLQMVETAGYFDEYVDDFLEDKADLTQKARKWVPQGTVGEVKSRENIEGKYIYVAVKIDQDKKCVVALQGFDTGTPIWTNVQKPITAIVHFKYCSYKTESEILDIFDGMRVKD